MANEQKIKGIKEKRKLTIAVVVVCVRFRWIIVIDRRKEVSCTCSPQYPEHLVRQLTEFTSSFPSQRTPTNFYFSNVVCKFLLRSFVVFLLKSSSCFAGIRFWFSWWKVWIFADFFFFVSFYFSSPKNLLLADLFILKLFYFFFDQIFHFFLYPRNKVFSIKEWFLLLFPLFRVFYGSFIRLLQNEPVTLTQLSFTTMKLKMLQTVPDVCVFRFVHLPFTTMCSTIGIKNKYVSFLSNVYVSRAFTFKVAYNCFWLFECFV